MTEDGVELYFIDAAVSSLHSAEMMLKQKRRAKAQEHILSSMYFAAKVNNKDLPDDFDERLSKAQDQAYGTLG